MKQVLSPLLFSLLLLCAACVKKVVPQDEFIDLHNVRLPSQTGYPYPNYCSGLSLDDDTITDFSTCISSYSGGQARYQGESFSVDNNSWLEYDFDTTAVKCLYGMAVYGTTTGDKKKCPVQKFRVSGETIITADTSSIHTWAEVSYSKGAGAQGIALLGTCAFSSLPEVDTYYAVVRKVVGPDIYIGYIEFNKGLYRRFRKFKKEDHVTLP